MHSVTHPAESTKNMAALHMALELGAHKWVVVFGTTMDGPRRRRQLVVASSQGMAGVLATAIADAKRAFGLAPDAPVRSCYEAGRDGFWVHRLLTTLGVDNCVVDSSSIEVNRRERQAKTDRLDAAKLLRMLLRYWLGERELWHVVRVPTVAAEDARHGTRRLAMLQEERTRWRNRIHAALMLHGVRLTITPHFLTQLAAARDWAGAVLPPGVIALVTADWTQLTQVQTALREGRRAARRTVRAGATRAAQWAARAAALRGIGKESALTLAQEMAWRDLRNRRQVGALTGLTAVPHDSGTMMQTRGVSRGRQSSAAAPRRGTGVGVGEVATGQCAHPVVSAPVGARRHPGAQDRHRGARAEIAHRGVAVRGRRRRPDGRDPARRAVTGSDA
jgi:transposase